MKRYKMEPYWINDKKYLYHSYKNEEALPIVLFSTFICLIFFQSGGILLPFIWSGYLFYCIYNQNKLDNDPRVKRYRKLYEEYIWEKFHETI